MDGASHILAGFPLSTIAIPIFFCFQTAHTMEHRKKSFAKVSSFLSDEIEPQKADSLLFICCLSSGLIDSTIYNGAIFA